MSKLYIIIAGLTTVLLSGVSLAQTFDFISIGQGYNGQVFYSMQNGEMASIPNTNWDLAFQIGGSEAAIRVNGKNDVRLFSSGFPVSDWSNLSPFDTINVFNGNNELYNSDTSWWYGAFNMKSGTISSSDLGWGIYDPTTQVVTGDSIYFLIMPGGSVKKLWIEDLTNGIYTFRHADIDGSNEVTATLNTANFQGKNFGYYSITNNATIDREPLKLDWDLTFNQYMAVTPIIYKVAGVLLNDGVSAAKAYPAEYSTADPWGQPFSDHINNIGYEWKSFDLNTFSWVIADSTVYFVEDRAGQIWKLMFTGFGGSTNGDYEFVKDPVSLTSAALPDLPQILSMYPNPASTMVRLVLNSNTSHRTNIRLYDLTGKLVMTRSIGMNRSLSEVDLDISPLEAGGYLMVVQNDKGVSHQMLQVVR